MGCYSNIITFCSSMLSSLRLAQLWSALRAHHHWHRSRLLHRCMSSTSSMLHLHPRCPGMAHGTNCCWSTHSTRWRSRCHPHLRSGSLTPVRRITPCARLVTSLLWPPNPAIPSSIVVGNGSVLPVTSVDDTVFPGPFYLYNVLVTPDIVKNILSVYQFTTDNWCSMEFDHFSLFAKDLAIKNMITRCNSSRPLYTIRLPAMHAP
jgi:hypothetical protein